MNTIVIIPHTPFKEGFARSEERLLSMINACYTEPVEASPGIGEFTGEGQVPSPALLLRFREILRLHSHMLIPLRMTGFDAGDDSERLTFQDQFDHRYSYKANRKLP